MKKTGILILLLICFGYVNGQNLTINGKITNNNYTDVYIDDLMIGKEIAAAPVDKNDEFVLKTTIDKTDFYKLRFDDNTYIILILTPDSKVDIEVDLNNILEPEIKGSDNSALVYSTFKETTEIDKKLEEYKAKIEEEKKDIIRKMIKENPNSMAGLFFIDQLDIDADIEIYKMLSDGLEEFSDHEMVKELNNKVKAAGLLAIGSEAPEIELPNPDGNDIKLSSLRGQYVLIDFWAAWCRPCRMESPTLVKAYEKFNNKGFTIYSISLDDNKADWVEAIDKDGLSKWTHVSDLQYWSSEAAQEYGVKSIPFSVLIDKKGKIIAKNLRGDALIEKLNEIF